MAIPFSSVWFDPGIDHRQFDVAETVETRQKVECLENKPIVMFLTAARSFSAKQNIRRRPGYSFLP
jgi:hypothetical protein